jgi:hypothetical protein
MNIFVSSQNIDEPHTDALIKGLQASGFKVNHSPRNPIHGYDFRWANWYETGLQVSLATTNIFIIAVDVGWDSSTWMAIEADLAFRLLGNGNIEQLYYYNPLHIRVKAKGALPYLNKQLPDSLNDTIGLLSKL